MGCEKPDAKKLLGSNKNILDKLSGATEGKSWHRVTIAEITYEIRCCWNTVVEGFAGINHFIYGSARRIL